jgi:hypothetical protein
MTIALQPDGKSPLPALAFRATLVRAHAALCMARSAINAGMPISRMSQ